MLTQIDEDEFNKLIENTYDAYVLLEDESYLDANQIALDLFDIPTASMLKSISPSMLSPKVQPDGETSAEKAAKIFQLIFQDGHKKFSWQHITLDGEPFDVDVLARVINKGGKSCVEAYMKLKKS